MAKKRARNDKGQLIGDDPTTPDVNEAWVEEDGSEGREKATKKAKSKKAAPKPSGSSFTMFVSASPESSVYDLRIGDTRVTGIWDGAREHVSWRVPSELAEMMMKHHFVWSGRVINAEED